MSPGVAHILHKLLKKLDGTTDDGYLNVNATLMERPSYKPGLILVVEDEPIIREFVCEMLGLEGYDTLAAENADLALETLNSRADDVTLLLTDIRMPGSMDGAELSNLTRDRWPRIPILIMSGHETPESSGVLHPVTFLRKPWTIGQMIDGVEHALGVSAS